MLGFNLSTQTSKDLIIPEVSTDPRSLIDFLSDPWVENHEDLI
jgi:hypothetical protein